ncbi:MAG: hypothetical protein BWY74_03451 [Firmicutes bacterium ADurb.Bin419]|nr:MAG: hypothetical protein BWY74_03451 [Firmicutes bacterium ADurb.Bin419]
MRLVLGSFSPTFPPRKSSIGFASLICHRFDKRINKNIKENSHKDVYTPDKDMEKPKGTLKLSSLKNTMKINLDRSIPAKRPEIIEEIPVMIVSHNITTAI